MCPDYLGIDWTVRDRVQVKKGKAKIQKTVEIDTTHLFDFLGSL